MKLFLPRAAIAMILAPLPALANEVAPISLARTSKWEINYDKTACHLSAMVGDPANPLTIRFTQYDQDDAFVVSLSGRRLADIPRWLNSTNSFTLGKPVKAEVFVTRTDGIPTVFLPKQRLDGQLDHISAKKLPAIPTSLIAESTWLRVDVEGLQPMRIEFGSLAKPFEALRSCAADLVKTWGFDPEELANFRQGAKPTGNPGTWVTELDYPKQAKAMKLEDQVTFRLEVDANGRVANCAVLASSGYSELDSRTCQALTARARFKAALDASGTAVRSPWIGTARWRLPSPR